ncbi:unnamed protein product, partial [Heterosigma akashiwo]
LRKWLLKKKKVRKRMEGFDLAAKLGDRSAVEKPLVKIKNLLPPKVAEGALELLKQVSDWQVSEARTDVGKHAYGAGSTQHRFSACAGGDDAQQLFEALGMLLPGKAHAFQAGCHRRCDFIEPHDDAGRTSTRCPARSGRRAEGIARAAREGPPPCCGRGGGGGGGWPRRTCPKFNTVAFHAPLLHQVEPVGGAAGGGTRSSDGSSRRAGCTS